MKSKKLLGSQWGNFDGEDVNPMDYVANLSDCMLVLAVGMMLALVVAWNVDVFNTNPNVKSVSTKDAVEFEQDADELSEDSDSSEETTPDDFGLKEVGVVYQGEDGKYYMLEKK